MSYSSCLENEPNFLAKYLTNPETIFPEKQTQNQQIFSVFLSFWCLFFRKYCFRWSEMEIVDWFLWYYKRYKWHFLFIISEKEESRTMNHVEKYKIGSEETISHLTYILLYNIMKSPKLSQKRKTIGIFIFWIALASYFFPICLGKIWVDWCLKINMGANVKILW